MGDKGDKCAARPPEGSLVETRCLIKGPKSAIVPFAEPRSEPKSKPGSGASQKAKSQECALQYDSPLDWTLISRNIWRTILLIRPIARF